MPNPVDDRGSGPSPRWLWLLLLLTLVVGVLYAELIPPWQGPDETGHFEYAWLLARLGRPPTRDDTSPAFEHELLGSLYEWRYGVYIGRPLPEAMPSRLSDLPPDVFARRSRTALTGQFSLSYAWQALFLLPSRSQDLAVQLRIARLSSVLINVAITWLAFHIFSGLAKGRRSPAFAMTAALVFLPQHTFINSMVGDGPLAELMACLVLYCWIRLFGNGKRVWLVPGIILGTVAAVGAKATASFLIPLDIGLAVWYMFRRPRWAGGVPSASALGRPLLRWTWRRVAFVCAGMALVGVAVWLFMRFPSPLGVNGESAIRKVLSARDWIWVDPRGITFARALLLSHDSFWAYFGWMSLPVGPRWYGALLLLAVAAAAGWIWGGKGQDAFAPWAGGLAGAALLTALAIFVWFSLLHNSSGYYQFQGRYLFPVVVPFVFLLVGGWGRVATCWRGQRPEALAWSGVAFLLLFDAWCVVGYIIPYFHSR